MQTLQFICLFLAGVLTCCAITDLIWRDYKSAAFNSGVAFMNLFMALI